MVIPEDYAQVNLIYSGSACPTGAEVTFGLTINAFSGTPVECAQAVADAVNASDFQSLTATGNDIDECRVKFGPDETGPFGSVTGVASCNGGTGSDSPAVALLVTKVTAHGGRRGRGRMYIPGLPASYSGFGGDLTPTVVTDANVILQNFLDELEGSDLGMVVLHGPAHPMESPYLVTSLICAPQVATQRRRNRR